MNPDAIQLYRNNNIDIKVDPLEIAVCAQHNNGGLKGTIWWESNIKHLFPVGEVNGTHGVYRPGGSALNAGQVGSLRAALFISKKYDSKAPELNAFKDIIRKQMERTISFTRNTIDSEADPSTITRTREEIQKRMSSHGAIIRNPDTIREACSDGWKLYRQLQKRTLVNSPSQLPAAFKNLDLCLTHALYLEAVREYINQNGKSRGSYIIPDSKGQKPCKNLDDFWRFQLQTSRDLVAKKILEIYYSEKDDIVTDWVDIRPVPTEPSWFETNWADFRENRIFEKEI